MNRDLRMMYRMALLLDRPRTGHLLNAPGVVEDLHQVTNEELNFALEAYRQAEFRAHIGAFGDNRWITAPVVYRDHCGPRVICMERLRGTPMDRFSEIKRGASTVSWCCAGGSRCGWRPRWSTDRSTATCTPATSGCSTTGAPPTSTSASWASCPRPTARRCGTPSTP